MFRCINFSRVQHIHRILPTSTSSFPFLSWATYSFHLTSSNPTKRSIPRAYHHHHMAERYILTDALGLGQVEDL